MSSIDLNVNYKSITENFLEAIDKHAPLKKKLVRDNQAPFMNRDFQKAVYTRTWKINFDEIHLEKVSQHTKNKEIYVYQ